MNRRGGGGGGANRGEALPGEEEAETHGRGSSDKLALGIPKDLIFMRRVEEKVEAGRGIAEKEVMGVSSRDGICAGGEGRRRRRKKSSSRVRRLFF